MAVPKPIPKPIITMTEEGIAVQQVFRVTEKLTDQILSQSLERLTQPITIEIAPAEPIHKAPPSNAEQDSSEKPVSEPSQSKEIDETSKKSTRSNSFQV